MTKPLQIALISFSHGHQMDYGRLLAEHPQTQLVGVGDVSGITDQARQVAKDFAASHDVPYYADFRQMLEEQHIDAVSIAVSPSQNPSVVITCATHGIDVLCEKPVASNGDGLDQLAKAVRESGIRFTTAIPATVFSNAFRPAIEQVTQGAIGTPHAAHFQFLQPRGPQYILSEEQCASEKRGELANFGPYGILAMLKFFGRNITHVFARMDAMFYERYKKHGVEDMALLSLTFEGGGVGTLLVGRTTTQTQLATDCSMQVIGSEGVLNIEQGLGYGYNCYQSDQARFVPYGISAGQCLVNDFVNAIKSQTQPTITLEHIVNCFRVIDAGYQSCSENKVVQIKM
ncbi:MAG: Gfo/Idh/MocA family protein [Phycisphaeraceae bacterium JB051]